MLCSVKRSVIGSFAVIAGLIGAGSSRLPDWGYYPPGWPGFAYNSQHWAAPKVASQPLTRVKWSTAVDIAPGGGAHYGTPMLTRNNTVVFPIRQASGAFVMNGRRASDGTVLWTL